MKERMLYNWSIGNLSFLYCFLYMLFLSQIGLSQEVEGQQDSISIGDSNDFIIDTLTLKSRVFENTRKIRVLLPPDYFEEGSREKKYPVLYLNDGVLTFHAYNLKSTVHDLIQSGQIEPLIIVGIDNGASTFEATNFVTARANEYLPWTDTLETPENQLTDPKGRLYPVFLLEEVMPLVDVNFRIDNTRVGLGGSSYGALIALYTSIHAPGKFERLLLESPSLYVSEQQIILKTKEATALPSYIYLGIGTKEGETEEIQNMALKDASDLNILLKSFDDVHLHFVVEEGAGHEFTAFSRRFPQALISLYGK